ncbi:MAG TPA: hypothetical protein VFJ30_02460 [Phycisphaerae bacterium]|nr:hypothetical protein [Phycisphaerae bacterium]
MGKRGFILVAVIVGCGSMAMADLSIEGDPIEGGSWKQGFTEDSIGTFDYVAVRMVTTGDSFQTDQIKSIQVHSSFNKSGWAMDWQNDPVYPTIAAAKGSNVTSLAWNIQFAGTKSNTFTFDYVALDYTDSGWVLKNAARATWAGKWIITNYPGGQGAWWVPSTPEQVAVPAPGALLLGASGLGVWGVVKRRLAR